MCDCGSLRRLTRQNQNEIDAVRPVFTEAIHQDLEREVAKYLSKEDALVLGMGRDHSAGKWVSEILPGPVVGEGLTGRCFVFLEYV